MSNLLGATEIRALADQLNIKPSKKLGQNFVVDANTCRKIVKVAGVTSADTVLEIGPGLGSLTLALLETAKSVIAIEIDKRMADQLPITAGNHSFDTNKLIVINQDALSVNKLPLEPTVLVANLPYNLAVPILLTVLERFPALSTGVVMVQSEVADRLIATPNNKNYGAPTVKANWFSDLSNAGQISRSVFWPIPNVDSSLVRFIRHKPLGDEGQRVATFTVVEHAFAKRRKMLRAGLNQLFAGKAEENLVSAGIDPTIRGEDLAVDEFLQIGMQLTKHNLTQQLR
ncbi:16S rRNA (adenine1518-N6/adenine1519-N6)-dimethyltransferase [Candidatus Nanopelagicus hibericus]|uniref:Ribosomal RNA small subunit methyltransferase A n=1 Tax=Candidatus Nanopelagicus hibericus TaxID=1884915 RepID=A0A249KAA8_9ACTN|nr:16S rRNA (adenine(1518)-N(6)/adenine(1519)-N(6))-dimethyltransferase RsmA [Candidatus Nanopelagicus hibericus]ASY13727.1 16S rRNA (adenine1518-N6/adenine1519-N6)-dimethyltransferase [Candidatus Nanopelagicus hibericus]